MDPIKDLHHVNDKNLLDIFGDKLDYKSYTYQDYKLIMLKSRIEEMYPTFLHTNDMPNFIPQSFACMVVSKVLHQSIIDWTKLASQKWRGKSNWSKPPIIL